MKKIDNFDKIQENGGSFKRIPDGAYIVGIKKVTDNPDKNYLRMELDVCRGGYKNWYQKLYDADKRETKYWPRDGVLVRSYSDKALPFFKGFITSVTKSNKNFNWEWDEQKLVNKVFGVVIGTEEYERQNGGIGKRPYIASVHSVETIEKGEYEIPALKKLTTTKATTAPANDPIPDFGDVFNTTPTDTPTPAESENPWDDSDDNPFNL